DQGQQLLTGGCLSAHRRPRMATKHSLQGGHLRLLELQREGVHAIAVTGRRAETVVEDVAEVAATVGAENLGANDAERGVFAKLHGVGVDRRVEARPTAVRVELGAAFEKFVAAGRTGIEAGAALIQQFAGPSALSRRFAQ